MTAMLELLRDELARKLDNVTEILTHQRAEILDPERMMTSEEVAELCHVGVREVHRWTKCGLPYYQLGQGFRFKRYEVLQFVDQLRTVEAA